MKYGFDIDGTITAAPVAFAGMMKALLEAGHEVHVITGQTHPITDADIDFRKDQLKHYDIHEGVHYSHLKIAGPPSWVQDKADYARDEVLNFMFENDPTYSQAISEFTSTTIMWVHK